MELRAFRILTGIFCGAFFVMLWQFSNQKGKTATAEKQLVEVCSATRGMLQITAFEIKHNGPDKETMIQRIHGTMDGVGKLSLRGCAPGLAYDAWMECVDKKDDACMIKMLNDAAKSIPQ